MKAFVVIAAAGAIALGGLPPNAIAGTFEVRSCAASAARATSSWTPTVRAPDEFRAGDFCKGGGSQGTWVNYSNGRWVRTYDGGSTILDANPGVAASLTVNAPPSAALVGIAYRRQLYSSDENWAVRTRAGGSTLESCEIGFARQDCLDLGDATELKTMTFAGSSSVAIEVVCLASPCLYGVGNANPEASQPSAAAVIYSSVVTVEENVAPTVGGVGVAGTNAAGWLGAGATASVNGSDTLGLRRLEVVDSSNGDAVVGAAVNSGCVDWSVLPCSEPSAGLGVGFSGTVAIGALADGAHQLRARAIDAAGNAALSAPVAVKVDRTAPVAVPTTSGGVIAGTSANFAWNAPVGTQHAPITAGRLKICTGPTAASLTCTWQAGVGASGSSTVPLGNDGDLTTVQVELTDEAGNVGLTPAVQLHRDTTAPAAPTLSVNTGANGRAVIQVNTADTDIAGYALRYCGPNGCADSRRPTFGFIEVDASSPGQYRAEVALVDNAGNIGPTTVATFDRATTNPPPPTTPPAPRTAIKLTVTKPIRLGSKRVALRGKTQAGSTSRITVSVTGRPAGRKRSVTKKTSVKPNRLGAWKLNAALPSGIPRGRKLTIKISAAPTERFTAATRTYTRRR